MHVIWLCIGEGTENHHPRADRDPAWNAELIELDAFERSI